MNWKRDIASLRAEMAQYQGYRVEQDTELARINGLIALYDEFNGWDAFRRQYLEAVRLRQLERECAIRIGDSDGIRTRIAGQRAEILFLIQSREELAKSAEALKKNINAVDEKMTKLHRKIERVSNV